MDALIAGSLFYQWIKDEPTITAFVGDRIYPTIPGQDEPFPLLVYTQTGFESPPVTIGTNRTDPKYRTSSATIQLTVRGESLSQVNNIVIAIANAINGKGNGGSIRLASIFDSSVDGDLDGDNQVLFIRLIVRQDA